MAKAMRETKVWVWQFFSAVVILALLSVHMIIMHLDGLLGLLVPAWADPLAWENMLSRGKSGFSTLMYILLLAAALFHGLYGVNTILTEFWTNQRSEKIIRACCWAAGITLFVIGTAATVVFHFSLGA